MDNEVVEEDNLSLIKNKQLIKSTKNSKLSEEERLELENNAKRKVMEKYHRMERLEDAITKNEKVAVTAWMQLASQLVEMFMNVRIFSQEIKIENLKVLCCTGVKSKCA